MQEAKCQGQNAKRITFQIPLSDRARVLLQT